MDDIEERLRSHAQAFDGLLSLIPAKYYYGDEDEANEQWQRKKQTKEQAREAKRAKLDPESAKTAKDVMDENARKRKREEGEAGSDSSDGELGSENPKEGLNRGDAKSKKQKQTEENATKSNADAEARKKQREEKKAQKKAAQKDKKKAKETAKKEKEQKPEQSAQKPANAKTNGQEQTAKEGKESDDEDEDEDDATGVEGLDLEFNPEQPSTASSAPNSPNFDASNPQSGSSSISSIVPPNDTKNELKNQSSSLKPLKPAPEELKQRLQKRLDELRAARHADGLNGKPARNRQELIEARRQKAEQRKTHKKLLRQKAKEDEQAQKDEAMARRFSPGGSGSLLASPRSPADSVASNNNYGFGRILFADGQHTDPTLSNLQDKHKSKQSVDPAAALKAAEAKKLRLSGLDEEKRADIEEKDMWLNAKKRAHGERVRDDTSLLKKALKRKESAKKKSEREWKERADGIAKGQQMRQSKREENLRKRREEKGNKGKKPSGGGKKKARPGFEGSFKAKVGGKKK